MVHIHIWEKYKKKERLEYHYVCMYVCTFILYIYIYISSLTNMDSIWFFSCNFANTYAYIDYNLLIISVGNLKKNWNAFYQEFSINH